MTSEDAQLIDVVTTMFKELSSDVRSLRDENKKDHVAQREATATLEKKVDRALERQDVHDAWHGKNDVRIAARLDGLTTAKHDDQVAADAVKKYKQRFKWVGELGIDAAKAGAALLASGLLLGIGYVANMIF